MNRKILSILLSVVLLISSTGMAFATNPGEAVFDDMPDNWSTSALKNAVANGLLGGYTENGKQLIKADKELLRAEMATIVNRAFAAAKKGDIAAVADVAAGAWYADEMAKAVKMRTFMHDTKMRPEDGITRQEAFTVLARAFKLGGGDAKALDRFSDKGDIAGWAQDSLAGMAAAGYIQGSGGKLQPKANITRAEFAVVMDNLVKQYIDRAETISEVADGNVIVRVSDVTLKDLTVKGDLIIADGVGEGTVTLDNIKVEGRTVVRGGGINSIIVKGGSDIGKVIVAKVDGEVRIYVAGGAEVEAIYVDDGSDDVIVEGRIAELELAGDNVTVTAKDATLGKAEISGDNSTIVVGRGSTLRDGAISGKESTIIAEEGGIIDKIVVSGPDASVEGEGTVKRVDVVAGGDGTIISTPGTETYIEEGVEAVDVSGVTDERKPSRPRPGTPEPLYALTIEGKTEVESGPEQVAYELHWSGTEASLAGAALEWSETIDGVDHDSGAFGFDDLIENAYTINEDGTVTFPAVKLKFSQPGVYVYSATLKLANGSEYEVSITVTSTIDEPVFNVTQEKGYDTLQAAIDGSNQEDTIKLTRNIELNNLGVTVNTDKVFTLNLAGHVLSGVLDNKGTSALITNNGTLTIKDSSQTKTGKITNQALNPDTVWEPGFPTYANNTITNHGQLVIDSGRIESTTEGGASYVIDNNSTSRNAVVIIYDGHVVNPNNDSAIRQFANSNVYQNKVVINGGIVEGARAVWIQLPGGAGNTQKATLEVNGGTLISTDKAAGGYNLAVYSYSFGSSFEATDIIFKDGMFDGIIAFGGAHPLLTTSEQIEVSGGYYKTGVYSYNANTLGFITGGFFTNVAKESSEAFLAEGYQFEESGNEEYPWVVVESND